MRKQQLNRRALVKDTSRKRPKFISTEEQDTTNTEDRDRKFKTAENIYYFLASRTDMKKLNVSDLYEDTFDGIKDALKNLNVQPENISVFQVSVYPGQCKFRGNDKDESFQQGKFTNEEFKLMEKSPVSNKTINCAKKCKRYVQRPDTKEKLCYVYVNGDGIIEFIILFNIFSDVELNERRKLTKPTARWNKGCSLSGHINSKQALQRFVSDNKAMLAYYGGYYDEYTPLRIEILPGNTSGRLFYLNRDGIEKSMQFGNCVARGIINCDKVHENKYSQKAIHILKLLGPFVYDPYEKLRKGTTSQFKMAVNHWISGDCAPPSWHKDGIVEAACLATAMPEIGYGPLSSITMANCDAGCLATELGGYILPYSKNDCIILNGEDLHGPVAVAPANYEKGKTNKGRVGRHSFVTFLKTNKKKVGQ